MILNLHLYELISRKSRAALVNTRFTLKVRLPVVSLGSVSFLRVVQ